MKKSDGIEIIGPKFGYLNLLDAEIEEELKKDEKDRVKGNTSRFNPLRPSSAGKCSRELAYDLSEFRGYGVYKKELLEPRVVRLLSLGYSIEFSALRNFSKYVKGLDQRYGQTTITLFEVKRGKGYSSELIEGKPDSCFFLEVPGEMGRVYKSIMDVKSFGDGWHKAFKTRMEGTLEKLSDMESLIHLGENSFYAPDVKEFIEELGPQDFIVDNIIQLNLYACSEFMKQRGIDHAWIYKYNKNNSSHYEIRFKPCMDLYKQAQNKFNKISVQVDKDKGPGGVNKDFSLGSIRCAFCKRKEECWGRDAKEVEREFYKTLPPKKWPVDTHKMENGDELESLFLEYENKQKEAKKIAKIEEKILKLLMDKKISKVRTSESKIYEVKNLRTKGMVLRRGKL